MAIRWERLTVKSQEAVQAAGSQAAEYGNPEVLPVHLMAALLEDREGVVLPVLEKVGVPVEQMLTGVNSAIQKLPKVQGGAQPGMSAVLNKVLEQAFKEAENFKDEYVSTPGEECTAGPVDAAPADSANCHTGEVELSIFQPEPGWAGMGSDTAVA